MIQGGWRRGAAKAVACGLGLLLASMAGAAEDLSAFVVRVGGKAVKTWTVRDVRRLALVEFANRQGKPRTAVALSTLLENSGVPIERAVRVTVTGLGGDAKKGPATRNIRADKGPGLTSRKFEGDDVASRLSRVVVFFNPDKHWTLADVASSNRGAWDQTRVRKVRRIEVILESP